MSSADETYTREMAVFLAESTRLRNCLNQHNDLVLHKQYPQKFVFSEEDFERFEQHRNSYIERLVRHGDRNEQRQFDHVIGKAIYWIIGLTDVAKMLYEDKDLQLPSCLKTVGESCQCFLSSRPQRAVCEITLIEPEEECGYEAIKQGNRPPKQTVSSNMLRVSLRRRSQRN